MRSQASFDDKADPVITFEEQPEYKGDACRHQSAMFTDRPDLWPSKKRPAHRTVKVQPGQLTLEGEEGIDNENIKT